MQINTKIFPKSPGAYIVGGAIRDLLRGRSPVDYDVAVVGNPSEFARQLAASTEGHLVEIGKSGQSIMRVITAETMIDISRIKGASIQEDLHARDFSINAMAYDLHADQLIDPLGGQQDLTNRTIRMVSNDIFKQDPVRLLRAFRIAAVLRFDIDPHTRSAIEKDAALIHQSAGERVREELFKMFHSTQSQPYLCQLADTGLLFTTLPELARLKECRQNRYHQFDAFAHTLQAYFHLEHLLDRDPDQSLLTVKGVPLAQRLNKSRVPLLKFAILLHDIGKPVVQTTDRDGSIHFYGHERQSAFMAEAICRRLKCATRDTDSISFLVRHHTRPLFLFKAFNTPKDVAPTRAVTRFFIKCTAYVPDLLICATADMLGKKEVPDDRSRAFMRFSNQLLTKYETDFKLKKSKPALLTGRDLIHEFGLQPSPQFKKILDRVEEERLLRSAMSRQEALAMVQKLIAEDRSQKTDDR